MDNNPIHYKDDNLVHTKEYCYVLRSWCSLCISNYRYIGCSGAVLIYTRLQQKVRKLESYWAEKLGMGMGMCYSEEFE